MRLILRGVKEYISDQMEGIVWIDDDKRNELMVMICEEKKNR